MSAANDAFYAANIVAINSGAKAIVDAVNALEIEINYTVNNITNNSYSSSSSSSSPTGGDYRAWTGTDSSGNRTSEAVSATNSSSWGSYATGGIAEGPISGYPVTMHGREAIIPLGDGNELTIDQSDLIEEIVALRAEVSELRRDQQRQHNATYQAQRDTRDVLEKWDTTGQPTEREAA
jgi:hypothetical protein